MQEVQEMLKLMEKEPTVRRIFFKLLAYTGCRKGEALGLEWPDFDFHTGIIHIEREAEYSKEKGYYTNTPKNSNVYPHVKSPKRIAGRFTTLARRAGTECAGSRGYVGKFFPSIRQ